MAVNLSPVFGVAGQLFDNNGNPLAGGRIFTYLAGTTTNATVYTSSSGNVAHSNPIILDGAGRVPSGEIWLTDGILYKFVVQDSANNLIGTYDNISGINSNFVAFVNQQEIITATAGQTVFNLSISYQPATNSLSVFVDGVNQYGPGAQYAYVETDANTVTFVSGLHVGAQVKFTTTQQQSAGVADASQVTYDPPFTGSVAPNVEAKLAQYVSVLDFGADPTDSIDSSVAIQAAIDTGKSVFVPNGTYRIENVLTFSTFGQIFYGESNEDTVLKQYHNGDLIHLDAAVLFRNFKLLGQKSTYTAGSGINMTTASISSTELHSVASNYFPEYGITMVAPGQNNLLIAHCETSHNDLDGIYMRGTNGNLLLSHLSQENGRDGIVLDTATSTAQNCSSYKNARFQIATGVSYGNAIVAPSLWVADGSGYSPILLACRQSKVDMTGGQVWAAGTSTYDVEVDHSNPSVIGGNPPTGLNNTLIGVLRVGIASGCTGTICIQSGINTFVDQDATQSTIRILGGLIYAGGADAARSPAFVANVGSDQSIPNNTATKVNYDTASTNINSNFNTATNRFTPTSPGRYWVHAVANFKTAVDGSLMQLEIRKNGGAVKSNSVVMSGTGTQSIEVSGMITMNGSTDYVEAFVLQVSGGALDVRGVSYTSYFEAFKVFTYPV